MINQLFAKLRSCTVVQDSWIDNERRAPTTDNIRRHGHPSVDQTGRALREHWHATWNHHRS